MNTTNNNNRNTKSDQKRPSVFSSNAINRNKKSNLSTVKHASKNTKKPRASPRKWTPHEQETFIRGLNKHGRDWKSISLMEGIINRSKESVSSHAQQYFAKLWRDGHQLPSKVQESGTGYTLSGKPLDPNSRTAQSVLGRRSHKTYGALLKYATLQQKPKPKRKRKIDNAKAKPKEQKRNRITANALSKYLKANEHYYGMRKREHFNVKQWRETPHLKGEANIYSDARNNKRRNTQHATKRVLGVSYSLPMNVEGFKASSGAVKHLAPLFIRPNYLGMLNEQFMDVTFAMYFRRIWFTPHAKLKQMCENTQNDVLTASPFDVLSVEPLTIKQNIATKQHNHILPENKDHETDETLEHSEKKQSDKQEMDVDEMDPYDVFRVDHDLDAEQEKCEIETKSRDYKVNIVYDKNDNRTYEFDTRFIPTMHHSVALPDITKTLVEDRVFNVVYFSLKDMRAIASNQVLKKWGLVDGKLRKEIFNKHKGKYMIVHDLNEILDDTKNGIMEPGIFFIHFRCHPLIGIQTFGAASFEDVVYKSNVVLYVRFQNAVAYLTKAEKKRNRDIRRAQKLGVVLADPTDVKQEEHKQNVKQRKANDVQQDSDYNMNEDIEDIQSEGADENAFVAYTLKKEDANMDVDKVSNDTVVTRKSPRKRRSYQNRDASHEIEPVMKKMKIEPARDTSPAAVSHKTSKRGRRYCYKIIEEKEEIRHKCDDCDIQFFDSMHFVQHMRQKHDEHISSNHHLRHIVHSWPYIARKMKPQKAQFSLTSSTKSKECNLSTRVNDESDNEDYEIISLPITNEEELETDSTPNTAPEPISASTSNTAQVLMSSPKAAQKPVSASAPKAAQKPVSASTPNIAHEPISAPTQSTKPKRKSTPRLKRETKPKTVKTKPKSEKKKKLKSEKKKKLKSEKKKNSKQDPMKLKTSRRINVKIELLVGYELFTKHLIRSQQTLLNSIMEYFGIYLQKEMTKRNNPKAPYYNIHTRDTFDYALAAISDTQHINHRAFTKIEYYMNSSITPSASYIEWFMNHAQKEKKNESDLRIVKSMVFRADEINTNTSDTDQSDAYHDIDHIQNEAYLSTQNELEKHHKELQNKQEMDCDTHDIDSTTNNSIKANVDEHEMMLDNNDNEDHKSPQRALNTWNFKRDGSIRDRMINGSKCIWVGATAYNDIYTQTELNQIEDLLDTLQAKSERNEYKKYTSQSTKKRRGVLVRTKHFFGARYLWHPSEFKREGKNKAIGAGLRVDVDRVPPELFTLVENKLVQYGIIQANWIQGIAFNMYHDGSEGIGPHFDDLERFDRPVITIRLFSDARIAFGTDLYGTSNGTYSIPLPRGCVLLLQKNSFAADGVKHTVRACDMYTKSAAIILRRFQQPAYEEAKRLEKMRRDNGYYNRQKGDNKEKSKDDERIVYKKGGKPRSNANKYGGKTVTDENKYTASDGFCVADDEPIEYGVSGDEFNINSVTTDSSQQSYDEDDDDDDDADIT